MSSPPFWIYSSLAKNKSNFSVFQVSHQIILQVIKVQNFKQKSEKKIIRGEIFRMFHHQWFRRHSKHCAYRIDASLPIECNADRRIYARTHGWGMQLTISSCKSDQSASRSGFLFVLKFSAFSRNGRVTRVNREAECLVMNDLRHKSNNRWSLGGS